MNTLIKFLLAAAFLLASVEQTHAQQFNYRNFFSQPQYTVDKIEDIRYGVGATNYFVYDGNGSTNDRSNYNLVTRQNLTLDLYEPQTGNNSGRRAVLILVPGSGRDGCRTQGACDVDTVVQNGLATSSAHYVSSEGDNYNELDDRNNRAANYARTGLVVISPITRYRYQNRREDISGERRWEGSNGEDLFNGSSAHLEPLIVDLKRVVRWLSHPDQVARYNIDPQNIFITGSSGGAKMSSLATMTPTNTFLTDDPAQLNSSHPDYQFEVNNNNILVPQVAIRGSIQVASDMNGTRHLNLMDSNTGDFMFWHSSQDNSIYHGMDEAIEEKCEYVGCKTQFYSLPGVVHGMTGAARALHTTNNQEAGITGHAYDFIVNHLETDSGDNRPEISISRSTNSFHEDVGTARIEILLDRPASQAIRFTAASDQMREVTLENGVGGRYAFIEQYVANDANSNGPVMYDQSTGVAFEDEGNLPGFLRNRTVHTSGPGQGNPVLIPQNSDYFFSDFVGTRQVITIPAGQTRAFFNVNIVNDTLSEDNECFKVRILNANEAKMSNTVETITILDDDNPNASSSPVCGNFVLDGSNTPSVPTQTPPPTPTPTPTPPPPTAPTAGISVVSMFVNEGSGQANLVVQSDRTVTEDVTLTYRTFGDTASSSTGDFEFTQGQATIRSGRNQVTVRIDINDDNLPENSERFFVDLQDVIAGNAEIDSARGIVTIIDNDDSSAPMPILSVRSIFVGEGSDEANLLVESDQVLTQPVTVSYRTFGGTASVSAGDFEFAQGQVTINANRRQATISVPILDDNLSEDNEEFVLELQAVTAGNALISNTRATVTIVDDDEDVSAAPVLSIRSIFVNEGSGTANLIVQSDKVVSQAVTVSYRTFGGTASSSAGDFEFTQGEATIRAGRDQTTITIPVLDDNISESREEFSVGLQGVTAGDAEFNNTLASVTIVDNDGTATSSNTVPRLTSRSIFVNEGSGQANIVLESDRAVPDDVVVRFRTTVGTAQSSAGDYIFLSGEATIREGNDRVTVRINILDDARVEEQENFFLTLTDVINGNAILVNRNVSITIVDNDVNQPQPSNNNNNVDAGIVFNIIKMLLLEDK